MRYWVMNGVMNLSNLYDVMSKDYVVGIIFKFTESFQSLNFHTKFFLEIYKIEENIESTAIGKIYEKGEPHD